MAFMPSKAVLKQPQYPAAELARLSNDSQPASSVWTAARSPLLFHDHHRVAGC
jgi:hypothetical protein